jgi:hypothetical protein
MKGCVALAFGPERALHRHGEIVGRIGDAPHPGKAGVRRHDDPCEIAVVGPRLQRLGPPRGDRQHRRPRLPQQREPVVAQRLGGRDDGAPAFRAENDREADAEIGPRPGEAFGEGGSEGHVRPLICPVHLAPVGGN